MLVENIKKVKERIETSANKVGKSGEDILLVAVSKTKPFKMIKEAYDLGLRSFGENKAQELKDKFVHGLDVDWHFIGRLQTNKVKFVVPRANLIHSVDRLKLLKEINKEATKIDKVINILLQIDISKEESKTGLDESELFEILENIEQYNNVKVLGLMTMAPFDENTENIRWVFKEANVLYKKVKSTVSKDNIEMKYLSMGMSNDFEIAIEEGANLVRVGSSIFGKRYYQV